MERPDLKVVIVDDSVESLQLIETFLKKGSFEVVTCSTVDQALYAFDSESAIDVLITDYHLGKFDAEQSFLTSFKTRHPHAISILMSGEDLQDWKDKGFDEFWLKPLNFGNLSALIWNSYERSASL